MTEIRVKDFGPIAEASVELKPLTVFMGPNGTGKSYLALAAYCLFRTLAGQVQPGSYSANSRMMGSGIRQTSSFSRRIAEEVKKAWPNARSMPRSPIRSEDLPGGLQSALLDYYRAIGDGLTLDFASELERCYGTKIGDLVKRGPILSAGQMRIGILDADSQFDWETAATEGSLATEKWNTSSTERLLSWASSGIPWHEMIEDPNIIFFRILPDLDLIIPRELILRAHYMPASRSGILMGHKVLAGFFVGQASRAWLQPIEIPRLPGVVTDFIQDLLLLERRPQPDAKLQEVIAYLENIVTRGTVDIEPAAEYPEVHYQNESGKYTLHQVSSMVSEIAPLVLYLKYFVRLGDLFIIEEPESHIDAENQRRLARAIAMLVNAGVKVLITTHSDFFVGQLNNLLLLSEVSGRRRAARKYAANEVLQPDTVGAYFFRPGDEGTIVETLEVTAEGGIPAEQFSDVHIATYDEAIALEHPVA